MPKQLRALTEKEIVGNLCYELPLEYRRLSDELDILVTDGRLGPLLLNHERDFFRSVITRANRESIILTQAFEAIGIELPYEKKRKAILARLPEHIQKLAVDNKARVLETIRKRNARKRSKGNKPKLQVIDKNKQGDN